MPKKIDENLFDTLGDMLHEEQSASQPDVVAPEKVWHPSLGETQKEIFDCAARFILVSGERGTGKCVEEGTRVWTPDGLIKIGDFCHEEREGFHLLDKPVGVTAFSEPSFIPGVSHQFYREGNPEAKEVKFENGYSVIGSPRHPLWTECDGSIKWRTTSEIQNLIGRGKCVYSPIKVGHDEWNADYQGVVAKNRWQRVRDRWVQKAEASSKKVRVSKTTRGVRESRFIEVDEDVGYLVGVLLGDGGLTGETATLSSADQSIFRDTGEVLRKHFSAGWSECKGDRYTKRAVGGDGLIWGFLLEIGVVGKVAADKNIPELFFKSPRSVVSSLLSGLFDTDGTVSGRCGRVVSFNTISPQLAKDVYLLLNALGVFSRIRTKNRKSGISFDVVVCGDDVSTFKREVGFRLERKQTLIKEGELNNPNKFTYPPSIVGEMREVFSMSRVTGKEGRSVFRTALNGGYIPSPKRLDEFVRRVGSSPKLSRYRLPSCRWVRITSVVETQARLCDLGVDDYHSFVAEGVINHNTYGILHKLLYHCWSEQNAEALIIVGIRGQATHGGAWDKLLLQVVPEWKEGMGLEVTDPKRDEQQYWYVHVRNRHGGWSKISLVSFPHSMQVAGRIRGFEPSIVFVDELTTIGTKVYFDAIAQQLGRRPGIEGPQQYIAATNPDGPRHWVHKRFIAGPWEEAKDEDGNIISPKGEWDSRYAYFQLGIHENKHNLPPGYYQSVMEAVKNDPIEYRRMILGEWVDRPDGEALFAESFRPEFHILKNKGKKSACPLPRFPVVVGYDLGQTSNAITFAQPILTKKLGLLWLIFDEIVHTNKKIPYDVLTRLVLRKMEMWERICKSDLRWYHVSDDSAFNQYRPADGGSFDHLQVLKWSEKFHKEFNLKAPIRMTPAPKFQGSKEARVRLTMQLLREDRILVSERCAKIIDMFMSLQSEKEKDGKYDPSLALKPKRSVHLHPFDSTSYIFLESELGLGKFLPGRVSSKVEIITKDS